VFFWPFRGSLSRSPAAFCRFEIPGRCTARLSSVFRFFFVGPFASGTFWDLLALQGPVFFPLQIYSDHPEPLGRVLRFFPVIAIRAVVRQAHVDLIHEDR